jgi:hypothetical protein
MTQIEFWQENGDRVFATVAMSDQSAVPGIGDLVYVPEKEDAGGYAYAKVVCRRFYYSQQGNLAMIRLTCEFL